MASAPLAPPHPDGMPHAAGVEAAGAPGGPARGRRQCVPGSARLRKRTEVVRRERCAAPLPPDGGAGATQALA